MKYKVGDEVLVKGEITEVDKDVPYPIRVKVCCTDAPLLFTEEELEEELIPVGKTYAQGLMEAWELAKKIQYSLTRAQLEEIFGTDNESRIMEMHTPEEALAKIEAYEKEKEIKVKDIVIYHDCPGIGVVTYVDSEHATVMWGNGRFGEYQKCYLERTGKTADGLDDLLRQIGEQ